MNDQMQIYLFLHSMTVFKGRAKWISPYQVNRGNKTPSPVKSTDKFKVSYIHVALVCTSLCIRTSKLAAIHFQLDFPGFGRF